jgi:hypothetical protein
MRRRFYFVLLVLVLILLALPGFAANAAKRIPVRPRLRPVRASGRAPRGAPPFARPRAYA